MLTYTKKKRRRRKKNRATTFGVISSQRYQHLTKKTNKTKEEKKLLNSIRNFAEKMKQFRSCVKAEKQEKFLDILAEFDTGYLLKIPDELLDDTRKKHLASTCLEKNSHFLKAWWTYRYIMRHFSHEDKLIADTIKQMVSLSRYSYHWLLVSTTTKNEVFVENFLQRAILAKLPKNKTQVKLLTWYEKNRVLIEEFELSEIFYYIFLNSLELQSEFMDINACKRYISNSCYVDFKLQMMLGESQSISDCSMYKVNIICDIVFWSIMLTNLTD